MLDALLTTEQAAALLGTTKRTLEDWRVTGQSGLPFVKVGRLCRYRPSDLEAFIQAHLRTNTGGAAPEPVL